MKAHGKQQNRLEDTKIKIAALSAQMKSTCYAIYTGLKGKTLHKVMQSNKEVLCDHGVLSDLAQLPATVQLDVCKLIAKGFMPGDRILKALKPRLKTAKAGKVVTTHSCRLYYAQQVMLPMPGFQFAKLLRNYTSGDPDQVQLIINLGTSLEDMQKKLTQLIA